jgi:hypothetical protein
MYVSTGEYVDWRGDIRNPGSISWSRKNTDYKIPIGAKLSDTRAESSAQAERLLGEALHSGYTPLQRALDTNDVDLLKANIGCITGWLLKGRPYHIIEHVKFHLIDYTIRLLRRTAGTQKYNAAYTMAVIKAECLRFIVKVDHPDQYPGARASKCVLLKDRLDDVTINTHYALSPNLRDVVLDDWIPLANNEQERVALVTLETMRINPRVRMRHSESMKLRDQILLYCAKESGLSTQDVLSLFLRVADETLTDGRIESAIRFMANLPR